MKPIEELRVLYLRIPRSLHRDVRIKAAQEDKTMNEIGEEALRVWLKRK